MVRSDSVEKVTCSHDHFVQYHNGAVWPAGGRDRAGATRDKSPGPALPGPPPCSQLRFLELLGPTNSATGYAPELFYISVLGNYILNHNVGSQNPVICAPGSLSLCQLRTGLATPRVCYPACVLYVCTHVAQMHTHLSRERAMACGLAGHLSRTVCFSAYFPNPKELLLIVASHPSHTRMSQVCVAHLPTSPEHDYGGV